MNFIGDSPMSIFKTKNGAFVTFGALEKAGLAVALNIENFLFKVNKIKAESWQADTERLISNIHTVLAQCDQNERYPARMLNSGGILTFVTNDNDVLEPLGMMMLSEKGGLQLGFGKVELRDLDPRITEIQSKLDEKLKEVLLQLLQASNDKDDFIAKVKSDDICAQLAALEKVLINSDNQIGEVISDLTNRDGLQIQQSSFDRPPLNIYTVKAIRTAAVREITEEVDFEINGTAISVDRLEVQEALNRETATDYVRSMLAVEDKSKFSAKEFNNDFESSTFVVNCIVTRDEFAGLTCKQTCQMVQPKEVQIKIINAEKGMLQTSITGYPAILGGGNQFTVALCCKDVFNKRATFVSTEAASPSVTSAAGMYPSNTSSTSSSNTGATDNSAHQKKRPFTP